MAQRPTPRTFILAFLKHWFTAMSGGLSVPFALLSAFASAKYLQAIFTALAFGGAWIASYRIWSAERARVLDLEKSLTPKFQLSFDQNKLGVVDATEDVSFDLPSAYGTPITQVKYLKAKYVRFFVEATTDAPIKNCEAYVVSLEKRDLGQSVFIHINLPQHLALQSAPFEVKPKILSPIDFVKSDEEGRLGPTPNLYWPNVMATALHNQATYRFTFVVHADGITGSPFQIDVNWQGEWDKLSAQKSPPQTP